ncbi:unnamed protein product, partial [Musa textilis]
MSCYFFGVYFSFSQPSYRATYSDKHTLLEYPSDPITRTFYDTIQSFSLGSALSCSP